MANASPVGYSRVDASASTFHEVDVLVIGGGPAGAWAAVSAASKGANTVLVDKGFCGSSGATAPSGTGVWHVPDRGTEREQAKASRFMMGGQLAEHAWMDRVLAQTWSNIEQLIEWGYPFPADEAGELRCTNLQGPDYMRLMRKVAKQAGVKILDHHPALELLVDEHGVVCGAAGVSRQADAAWQVHAGAVVLATGGCAFLSKALGCNVLTGDGYLLGSEVGAELSGMEFSNAYGLGPAWSSITKSLFYNWGSFYDHHGQLIPGAGSSRGRGIIAKILQTQSVYCKLDRADPQIQTWMRSAQPNFFLSFDRRGIDPFTQAFPVTLRLEGTVRGTGGLHVVNEQCGTTVPGLFAAGDASTRELICGGFTGGGSHNAAWAMSSGLWAGAGAADFAIDARSSAHRPRWHAGQAGVQGDGVPFDSEALIRAVQAEVLPTEKNWSRHADVLEDALQRLDGWWHRVRNAPAVSLTGAVRGREAVAMLATARWMYRSALSRTESRGMSRRLDYTDVDPDQHHRLVSGGLNEVFVRQQAVSPRHTVLEGRTQ